MNRYCLAMQSTTLFLIFISVSITPIFPSDITKCSGLSEEECKNLIKFSKRAKEIKSRLEGSNVTSMEIRQILGKPEAVYKNNEEGLRVKGQKEIWMYWHPCYATVRLLLVFNNNDNLIMFTAVQQLHPKIGDVYYDVDYFLE